MPIEATKKEKGEKKKIQKGDKILNYEIFRYPHPYKKEHCSA
jgi:hypothetical protein